MGIFCRYIINGHVACQIKGNEIYNNMEANILP